MAIVLAALSLLGLGIFGPGIENSLISGGPQLGAGAAIGTGVTAATVAGTGMAEHLPISPHIRSVPPRAWHGRGNSGRQMSARPRRNAG